MDNKDLSLPKCPSCGGDLLKSSRLLLHGNKKATEELFALCALCHKEYNTKTPEFYTVFAEEILSRHLKNVLSINGEGVINGIGLKIKGRICYFATDRDKIITKWLALDQAKNVYYIFEYDNKFFLGFGVQDLSIKIENELLEFEGKNLNVVNSFALHTIFFEGEIDSINKIGKEYTFYEAKLKKENYIIIKGEAKADIIKAIPLTLEEIAYSFGLNNLKEKFSLLRQRIALYKNQITVYLLCALISLFYLLSSFIMDESIKGIETSRNIISLNQQINDRDGLYYVSQILYGPFEIVSPNFLYEIAVVNKDSKLSFGDLNCRIFLLEENKVASNISGDFKKKNLKSYFDDLSALPEPVESFSLVTGLSDRKISLKNIFYWGLQPGENFFVISKEGKYYLYCEIYGKEQIDKDSIALELKKTQSRRYFFVALSIFILLALFNEILLRLQYKKMRALEG